MKIALITFHDTTNFGALLQTYGLYKKLNDLGYDCSLLDYQCESQLKNEIPAKFQFSINPRSLVSEILVKSKKRRKYTAMKTFTRQYMSKISKRYDRQSVFNIKENYDTYVVGSDMLWGLDMTGGDFSYFLDFVPDEKRKFSYASSIGKREWTEEERGKISKLLNRFQAISVREKSTVDRLKSVVNKECYVVCDPTMLVTPEEWQPYVGKRLCKKDYVLVYFDTDDRKCSQDAVEYAKKNKKKLLVISQMPSIMTGTHNVFPYKVEDFLSLFFFADTVFTASYHGLLYSLYFHKNFVYYNRQPAYRMQTVAELLGIEGREGRVADIDNLPKLNYHIIDEKMAAYRDKSIDFIKETLR